MTGTPLMHPSGVYLGSGLTKTKWTNAFGVLVDTQMKDFKESKQ